MKKYADYLEDVGIRNAKLGFIASRGSQKYYLQSAFALSSPEKTQQEQNSLLHVNDHFKKMIIVRDSMKPRRNEQGIVTMGIINFLLDEASLEA